MDICNVPKKVNRHVIKAIKNIKECGDQVTVDNIIQEVTYTTRNLVPVSNLDCVVQKSLQNLLYFGIVRCENNIYAINPQQSKFDGPQDNYQHEQMNKQAQCTDAKEAAKLLGIPTTSLSSVDSSPPLRRSLRLQLKKSRQQPYPVQSASSSNRKK